MPAKGDSFEPGRVTISDSASDASASDAETVNMPRQGKQQPTAEYPEVTRRLAASGSGAGSPAAIGSGGGSGGGSGVITEEDTGTGWPDEDDDGGADRAHEEATQPLRRG